MDGLLALYIYLLTGLARLSRPLSVIGFGEYREWHPGEKLKILLVGYNGARNTGADVRVAALARQLKEIFDPANLYAADSSLFPHSEGLPPILTIMALAMKIAETAQENTLH